MSEEIDVSIPEFKPSKKWLRMKELFSNYLLSYAIGCNHYIEPLFHTFLGTILTNHYIEYKEEDKDKKEENKEIVRNYDVKGNTRYICGGSYRWPRYHCALILPTGHAKGQAMKSLFYLTKFFTKQLIKKSINSESSINFLPPVYLNTSQTDAFFVGTVVRDHNGEIKKIIKGAFWLYSLILWDEGSIIFNEENKYNPHIITNLQSVTDEPGMVNKGLAGGIHVAYLTNVNVGFGTYVDKNISASLFKTGLIPRFRLLFKAFDIEQSHKNTMNSLDITDTDWANVSPFSNELVNIILNTDIPEVISINKEDKNRFKKIFELYLKYLERQYADDRQTAFCGFIARLYTSHVLPLAVHYAVFNGKKEVDFESLCYGLSNCQEHTGSAMEFLDHVRGSSMLKKVDTYTIITNLFTKEKSVWTRKDLLAELKKLMLTKVWKRGYNGSIRALEECVKKGILIADSRSSATKPERIYYLSAK